MARRPKPPAPPPVVLVESGTAGDDALFAFSSRPARFSGLGGNDTLNGSTLGDTLDGGDGNDWLYDGDHAGSAGTPDTLLGGAGDDFIFSQGGGSLIDGGAGFDRGFIGLSALTAGLTMSGALGSGSTATLSDGTILRDLEYVSIGAGSGDDSLQLGGASGALSGNAGNDTLRGGAGDDVLDGGAGRDRLTGDAGADRLYGGEGADTLSGGAGADLFQRSDLGGGVLDRILDFNRAEGDRYDAMLFRPDALDEGVIRIADPLGEGVARLTDTAEGVLIEVNATGSFVGVALLVGTTVAVIGTDIFV